jgi:hypothetical protein
MLKATSKLCEGSQLRGYDVLVGAEPNIFHLTGGVEGELTLKCSQPFYEIVEEHRGIQNNRFTCMKHRKGEQPL